MILVIESKHHEDSYRYERYVAMAIKRFAKFLYKQKERKRFVVDSKLIYIKAWLASAAYGFMCGSTRILSDLLSPFCTSITTPQWMEHLKIFDCLDVYILMTERSLKIPMNRTRWMLDIETLSITLEVFKSPACLDTINEHPNDSQCNAGRLHEECENCVLQYANPNACEGHPPGPSACKKFKEK